MFCARLKFSNEQLKINQRRAAIRNAANFTETALVIKFARAGGGIGDFKFKAHGGARLFETRRIVQPRYGREHSR